MGGGRREEEEAEKGRREESGWEGDGRGRVATLRLRLALEMRQTGRTRLEHHREQLDALGWREATRESAERLRVTGSGPPGLAALEKAAHEGGVVLGAMIVALDCRRIRVAGHERVGEDEAVLPLEEAQGRQGAGQQGKGLGKAGGSGGSLDAHWGKAREARRESLLRPFPRNCPSRATCPDARPSGARNPPRVSARRLGIPGGEGRGGRRRRGGRGAPRAGRRCEQRSTYREAPLAVHVVQHALVEGERRAHGDDADGRGGSHKCRQREEHDAHSDGSPRRRSGRRKTTASSRVGPPASSLPRASTSLSDRPTQAR